ncbi:MAG: nicotinamide mononucleotide transporter [Desulfobacterales bacterium]|jgi:nicotinamide riboside transporter PnuC|nr:nicotinamide mononucleotide transporter [Desulfobacterales bacterium]
MIEWVVTALSIIGAILNARCKVSGFYFWTIANLSWVVIDFNRGPHAQAALFLFYFATCLYGIYSWKNRS